jgi:hypothetical protein
MDEDKIFSILKSIRESATKLESRLETNLEA